MGLSSTSSKRKMGGDSLFPALIIGLMVWALLVAGITIVYLIFWFISTSQKEKWAVVKNSFAAQMAYLLLRGAGKTLIFIGLVLLFVGFGILLLLTRPFQPRTAGEDYIP